jgi:hypothetical protein
VKNLALIVSLAIAWSSCKREVSSQRVAENKSALQDTLTRLENRSWEAWKNRDGQFFQQFLSDDHVEVGFTGVAGKAAIVAFVASPVCLVKSYAVENFTLTIFNENTALLTYRAEQDTSCGGKAVPSPVWASSLYVRQNGVWLNALYQQTAITRS